MNVSYSLALGPSGSGIVSRIKAPIEEPKCPSGWPLAVLSSLRTPWQTNFGEMGPEWEESAEPETSGQLCFMN